MANEVLINNKIYFSKHQFSNGSFTKAVNLKEISPFALGKQNLYFQISIQKKKLAFHFTLQQQKKFLNNSYDGICPIKSIFLYDRETNLEYVCRLSVHKQNKIIFKIQCYAIHIIK